MTGTGAVFTVCNLIILPLLIADGVRRLMKLDHSGIGATLAYFGWTYFLSMQTAKRVSQMMAIVLQREVPAESLRYTFYVLFCSAGVAFMSAVIMKNVSVSVEFRNEE